MHWNKSSINWDGVFDFKDVPVIEVLKALAIQYSVQVEYKTVVKEGQMFTGQFDNKNLEQALQNVTWPLFLDYNIKGKTIYIETKE